MLSLQTFVRGGWVPVGTPYEVGDTQAVQQAVVVVSRATGAVWRVVGSGGNVLALWDGRRWHAPAEAQPAPAPFWQQDPDAGFDSTTPVRVL